MTEYKFSNIYHSTYLINSDNRVANNLESEENRKITAKVKQVCDGCEIKKQKKCNGVTAITRGRVITGAETPPANSPLLNTTITV